MKMAELEKGKSYFVYGREHWISAGYGETYYKVAQALNRNRLTPVFDENGLLKRDYQGKVYMQHENGYTERVVLKSIRSEFFDAVALITRNNRDKYDKDKARARKYAEHLKRKQERERNAIEKPIKDEFYKALNALAPKTYISTYTELNKLPIEAMQAIVEALKSKKEVA